MVIETGYLNLDIDAEVSMRYLYTNTTNRFFYQCVFAFHEPNTLLTWLRQDATLRARLQQMPSLDKRKLRACQVNAVQGLETSLGKDSPRSLIQMATGAGKTFTACTFSYRLIKYAKAKRILFLVDRSNLGDQTLKEFQQYEPPGSGRLFAVAESRVENPYVIVHGFLLGFAAHRPGPVFPCQHRPGRTPEHGNPYAPGLLAARSVISSFSNSC